MNLPTPFILLLLLLSGLLPIQAQDNNPENPPTDASTEKSDDEEDSKKTEEDKTKTIEELTKDSELMDGLFRFYRDQKTGTVRLLLSKDELDKEYLYFAYAENGPPDSGWLTRGAYQISNAKMFVIRRFFNHIEFIEKNTRYYFDPEKAISRAANANVSHSVFFQEKIESENEETGEILIKVDGLFLGESFIPIAPLPNPEKKPHEVFSLGALSKDKSKIRTIKSYPENSDVRVEYVFENKKPYKSGSSAVTDPRFISVVIQHSLIAAPDEPMEPRFDDPRVGYFGHEVTDLSSTEPVPYRDMIKRWRLEKKDPDEKLSEPVKPIVYWIENTTPIELRPIIEKAALRWNEAFEAAGFKNAFQIKVQPDDADWDAGDIRYNVLRWVSSPQTMYGGYGPSFLDPRSGEILGADIMLEHSVISRQIREGQTLGDPSIDFFHDNQHPERCSVSFHAKNEFQFANLALEALGASGEESQRLLEEFIYFLTLHEIGHTLGLSHNFKSSYLHSLEDVFDTRKTYSKGLQGSVMEYPAIPFASKGEKQGQYWTTRPGPYDKWAIEFGYRPDLNQEELEALLARSTDPELAFALDADDMRSPGRGIDPRAMINDMTSDPIGFSTKQIALIKSIQPELRDRLVTDGESYEYLRGGFWLSYYRFEGAVTAISRHIGGVYVDRAMAGQKGETMPLTPVSLEDQKRAMSTLEKTLFAPDAFDSFNSASNYLLAQRRFWNHRSQTEDPKFHESILQTQKRIFDHLLNPKVLARLTDAALYGNEYHVDQYLVDLTHSIFEADLNTSVKTYRQNLQLEYVARLLKVVNGDKHDRVAQSMALNRLRWIEDQMENNPGPDLLTTAHRENVLYQIESGLDPR